MWMQENVYFDEVELKSLRTNVTFTAILFRKKKKKQKNINEKPSEIQTDTDE